MKEGFKEWVSDLKLYKVKQTEKLKRFFKGDKLIEIA